jgi:hypothetical protein
MARHFIEVRSLSDWQSRLGDPELHWKRGASAMELAVSWTLARNTSRGMPAAVAGLLDAHEEFADASAEFAIPELRTKLPGGSTASQTDLWALLRNQRGTIGLSVEGKALEPFGETVDRWLGTSRPDRPPSNGRLERLKFLASRLGLDPSTLGALRYQLLHRTVASLIEAENWRATSAVMLVQRFADDKAEEAASWCDFREFAWRLQAQVQPDAVVRASVPGNIPLYLGWLNCDVASDADLLAAMLERRPRNLVPSRNAFEALCLLANRESWCWRLTCTTCGCMHFRYGLAELANGKHPAAPEWTTRSATSARLLSERLGPMPEVPLAMQTQQEVITVASTAKLTTISSRARFPDWLGYLGVVLSFCRDAEIESRLLTASWVPQLCAMLPAGSRQKQRIMDKSRAGEALSLSDLEAIEHELTH